MEKRSFINKEVTCNGCGNKFPRTSNRQWWCSRSCGDKFKRKLARAKKESYPKYHRICGYCKKEYGTNLSRKVFCSIAHKELFYNELQKQLGLRNKYRQAKLCDGKWHDVLQKAEYTCEICGLPSKTQEEDGLIVHHVDGNGTYMNDPNNEIENLAVLCRKCHKMFHGLSLVLCDGEWKIKSKFLRLLGCHSVGVI